MCMKAAQYTVPIAMTKNDRTPAWSVATPMRPALAHVEVTDNGNTGQGGDRFYDVLVTNDSGHFQPTGVPDETVRAVRAAGNTSRPNNTRIRVRKRER